MNLLIFLYFLLGAYGAELFPLLIRDPEIVLTHPQMENPDAVHTHEQHCIRHELRETSEERRGDFLKVINYPLILAAQ